MLVLRSIAVGVLAAIALGVLSFGAASLFHFDAVGLYIAPVNLILPLLGGILPSGWAYAVVPSGGPAAGVLLVLVSAILPWTYAFLGLLAGDAILLLYLLQNAIRLRADLLAVHMGEPERQIPQALQIFNLYARLSFLGWMFVGLPIALFLPAHLVRRLPWPLRPFVGAALGPVALFLIVMLVPDASRTALMHGHMLPGIFRGTATLWPLSILVSTVSFVLYVALLPKEKVMDV